MRQCSETFPICKEFSIDIPPFVPVTSPLFCCLAGRLVEIALFWVHWEYSLMPSIPLACRPQPHRAPVVVIVVLCLLAAWCFLVCLDWASCHFDQSRRSLRRFLVNNSKRANTVPPLYRRDRPSQ